MLLIIKFIYETYLQDYILHIYSIFPVHGECRWASNAQSDGV